MQLGSDFFEADTVSVARDLLGKELLYKGCGGIIIETEAYHQSEAACHAYQGKQTPRTLTMFQKAGTLYVYRIHQVICLNIVTETEGIGSAVLIRALKPTTGIAQMRQRRSHKPTDLCSGPGKLCQSLGINLGLNGAFLQDNSDFIIRDKGEKMQHILSTPRIGISKATDLLWRFCVGLE